MRRSLRALLPLVAVVAAALGGGCSGTTSASSGAASSAATAQAPPRDSTEAIDRALAAAWKQAAIEPAAAADDATWLRRVTIDTLGRVPTEAEVRAYLAEAAAQPDPTARRARAVDRLLADPLHATRLARWWEDVLLGPESRKQRLDRGALRRWLEARFARNEGWNAIVTALITAEGTSSAGGDRFDRFAAADDVRAAEEEEAGVDGAVNWILRHRKSPSDVAGVASRAFLGVQIQCAQCHDHKTEAWKQDDFASFAASFAEVRLRPVDRREGIFRVEDGDRPARRLLRDELHAPMARAAPRALDGTDLSVETGDERSRREHLAAWITSRDNPWTSRAFVNRVWTRLHGMGFVDPVDDFRPSKAPVLASLLDDLAERFESSGWDVRALERSILLSRPYALAAAPLEGDVQDALWSRFAARPLDEDALVESLFVIVDAERRTDRLSPRAGAALRAKVRRSVALAFDDDDAESNPAHADATVQQVLLIMNAELVDRGVSSGPRGVLAELDARERGDDRAIVDALFVRTLGRPPTAAEQERARALIAAAGPEARDEALEDVFWALLNTAEMATVR